MTSPEEIVMARPPREVGGGVSKPPLRGTTKAPEELPEGPHPALAGLLRPHSSLFEWPITLSPEGMDVTGSLKDVKGLKG